MNAANTHGGGALCISKVEQHEAAAVSDTAPAAIIYPLPSPSPLQVLVIAYMGLHHMYLAEHGGSDPCNCFPATAPLAETLHMWI